MKMYRIKCLPPSCGFTPNNERSSQGPSDEQTFSLCFHLKKKKKKRVLNTTLTIIYQHHFVFVPNNQILCLWNHSKGNKRFQFTIRKKERKQLVELSGYWMGNANGVFLFLYIYKLDKSCAHMHPCSLSCMYSVNNTAYACSHTLTHTHTHTGVCTVLSDVFYMLTNGKWCSQEDVWLVCHSSHDAGDVIGFSPWNTKQAGWRMWQQIQRM